PSGDRSRTAASLFWLRQDGRLGTVNINRSAQWALDRKIDGWALRNAGEQIQLGERRLVRPPDTHVESPDVATWIAYIIGYLFTGGLLAIIIRPEDRISVHL